MQYSLNLIKGRYKIAVWGTGYIGLSTMAFFSRKKVPTVGYDIDEKKIKIINSGKLPIKELKDWFGFSIKDLVKKKFLSATNDYGVFNDKSFKVHFIAIPTEKNGKPYFKILFNVIDKIIELIKNNKKNKLILIIESTLTPLFSEKYIIPYFKRKNYTPEKILFMGSTKKRLVLEGTKSLVEIDRVFGSTDKSSTKIIKDILSIVCKNLHESSSHRVSEMVKSIENAYRHMEITLANQLSIAYPKEDMREVLKMVGTKWNIGTFYPGFGTGGYCIPLSSQYVVKDLKDKKKLTLLRETIKTDNKINLLIARSLIKRGFKKVGVLGLSYKGDLKVHILSPVIPFVKHLIKNKIKVSLFDPHFTDSEIKEITGARSFKFPHELKKFDCVVISVDHKEFKINQKNIVKHLSNCKFILDNMQIWKKIKLPNRVEYKISGEKNWL